jgi:hypothetical protein
MTKPFEVSPRLEARLAGGLYLLSIVFGMAAILFIRRKMLARGDQATPSRGSPLQRYDLAAIALIMASEQVDFGGCRNRQPGGLLASAVVMVQLSAY